MTNWQTKNLGELLSYEQPTKYLVKDTDYLSSGTPVLTANKSFVLGYTNEDFGVCSASKDNPVIIFDDFTTDKKLVNFNFKVKSSAIKILKSPNPTTTKFVFGAMSILNFETSSHKRYYLSEYQFSDIKIPAQAEQGRIVGVLEVWDDYIEKLERKIELKEQLKKGLMQQLLTSKKRLPGFNEAWKKVQLSELANFVSGFTFLSSSYVEDGKYGVVTIANVQNGRLDLSSYNAINDLPSGLSDEQKLSRGDILISMTGNVGRVCIVDRDDLLLNQRVGKLVPKESVTKDALYSLVQNDNFIKSMIKKAQGGAQDNLSSGDIMKHMIWVPKDLGELANIADIFTNLNTEIDLLKTKLNSIKQQKQFLLKNLISGKIRTPEDILTKGVKA